MVGKNGSFSSAAMGERGREIFKSGRKTTLKNFKLLVIKHAVLRFIKLKYMLCGYNDEYSVSTKRT